MSIQRGLILSRATFIAMESMIHLAEFLIRLPVDDKLVDGLPRQIAWC